MPNALIDRAHAWLGRRNDAHWDERRSAGDSQTARHSASGYLEGARDGDRYASAEFRFIGFDELTQFSEKQYLDLFARLARSSVSALQIRRAIPHPPRHGSPPPHQRLPRVRRSRAPELSTARDSLRICPRRISLCACARRRTPASRSRLGQAPICRTARSFTRRPSVRAGAPRRQPTHRSRTVHKSLLNLDPVTRARDSEGRLGGALDARRAQARMVRDR